MPVKERLDVLRSLVRQARERASERIRTLPPVVALRRAAQSVRDRRIDLTDEMLTGALARAAGVVALSATASDGAVRIDARLDRGGDLQVALAPAEARFAPHGPKELTLHVSPPEAARDPAVAELASALAGVVAHGIWGFALGRPEGDLSGALVEREGDDRLRIDLRTVPAVRRLLSRGAGMLVDVVEIGALRAEDGKLSLSVRLPGLPF